MSREWNCIDPRYRALTETCPAACLPHGRGNYTNSRHLPAQPVLYAVNTWWLGMCLDCGDSKHTQGGHLTPGWPTTVITFGYRGSLQSYWPLMSLFSMNIKIPFECHQCWWPSLHLLAANSTIVS